MQPQSGVFSLNRTIRRILIITACITAFLLIIAVGQRAFQIGNGMLLLQEDAFTGYKPLSEAEQTELLNKMFPRALAYAVASVIGIILFISRRWSFRCYAAST
ncbi:hypothetical protein [Rhizobium leguminosarum]|uniref:hypothetical protein n=1 Tax=Rhizobium leguminosarum TaxID=384 RepID=UPI0013BBBEA4|nr:hypothetical protein [Rhizobium leguminosarum]NEI65012.1 hypothetical protein [Rhizobium leguminosarum]